MPGVVALLKGTEDPIYQLLSQRLPEGVVALLAASLLFLLPVSWSPPRGALAWREAVLIDWGTILLFGGGLAVVNVARVDVEVFADASELSAMYS